MCLRVRVCVVGVGVCDGFGFTGMDFDLHFFFFTLGRGLEDCWVDSVVSFVRTGGGN